ncbi:MAG: hypothetical protein Q8Q12_07745 [bacterium]|nr:hypothetical protein [bacterium]
MRVIDNPDFSPKVVPESAFWRAVGPRVETIFGVIPADLIGEDVPLEMLRQCYVTEASRYDSCFLEDIDPTFTRDQVIEPVGPEETYPTVEHAVDAPQAPLLLLPGYAPPRVVVLVGDIGVGKSTYLWYHRRLVLDSQGIFCPIISVGSPATREVLCGRIREKLRMEVFRRIDGIIKGHVEDGESANDVEFSIYEDVLRRNRGKIRDAGPADVDIRTAKRRLIDAFKEHHPDEVLRREIQFIRSNTGKHVIVVLDEVDRLPQPSLRDYLLDFARDLAHDLNVTVVVATRTYTRSLMLEYRLAGAHYLMITLQPPDLGEVIERRLSYVGELFRRNPDFRVRLGEKRVQFKDKTSGISLECADVIGFIQTCCRALLRSRSLRCIESLSNQDVRHALELVSTILRSPHLHQDALKLACGFSLRHHEVVHILALGSWSRYNPAQSAVVNLFDTGEPDRVKEGNTLLRIRTLQTVAYLAGRKDTDSRPCDVVEALTHLGYDRSRARNVVKFLIDSLLVDTDDRTAAHRGDLSEVGDLRLAPAGFYYLASLIYELRYAEEVQDDVHWADGAVPLPACQPEGRASRQERVERLVERIRSDEQWEANRIAKDEVCDTALYEAVRGVSLATRLRSAHQKELQRIRASDVSLEGYWHFSQEVASGCDKVLGRGIMKIRREADGQLRAEIDTALERTAAVIEQSGADVVLRIEDRAIAITGKIDPSTRTFLGKCDCRFTDSTKGCCRFHISPVGVE